MTDFRQQIRTLLKHKKISIALLARQANLNQATLYNYLAGRSEMTAANLEKVFDVLQGVFKE